MKRGSWTCIVCVGCAPAALVLFSGLAAAQTELQEGSRQSTPHAVDSQHGPAPTFRADTNLVVIPVTVTDTLNRFVLGLQQADFHLFEDGVEQDVAHFSGEDAPLSVGLVFDESGSMDYKLRNSRNAAAQFLKTFNTDDEAFLVEFGDNAKLSVEFTTHTEEIQSALKNAQPGGLTAMLDAINTGLHEMKKAKNPRKAIVIVSDGGDNHSHYTAAEIESLVRGADVQVYAMGVFEPILSFGLTPEEISGPRLLSEIAAQTGGRAFSAALTSDLPSVATRIAIELRNQYVLAYYPKNQARDGKYRKVEVKLSQPHGMPPLKAHWRLGYYAPPQ
ncbi:MAG TPA: VWA domain-containing protein [Candidatus Acidoferrales bacterium]|nr:VWA domain-containing protein [Candidatus Acidoferrales bacterium]